ncbi:hypothetical protein [Burkholderia multivorans]|uniref:hypothetical protein n=1 Tax=Burkholderia multivorans TaxID=87883 RepID=UPI0020B3D94F|nr:hypothetical protein [Burkholderia multivorans]
MKSSITSLKPRHGRAGSHAADIHLGAAIGIFDLWRCLMVELGTEHSEAGYMSDAKRLEALLRLASLSGAISPPVQGDGETA